MCEHCEKTLDSKSIARHIREQHHEIFLTNGEQEEEVNVMMVPRRGWEEPRVKEAKQEEVRQLAEWETYEMVDDIGQEHLKTTWIIWQKDEKEV